MANRHLARTIALQTLYQWDFRGCESAGVPEALSFVSREFAQDNEPDEFCQTIVKGVLAHCEKIDFLITKYAPQWPIENITVVDRNVLRIGIFELGFVDEIPARVAINEAIEMAKKYGGESSGRFINGVLGAIYKDMLAQGIQKEIDKQHSVPRGPVKKDSPLEDTSVNNESSPTGLVL